MAFYRNMVVPTKSEDIAFEEFLKELPADYSEMAHEFFERDGARNFATWSSAVGHNRTTRKQKFAHCQCLFLNSFKWQICIVIGVSYHLDMHSQLLYTINLSLNVARRILLPESFSVITSRI